MKGAILEYQYFPGCSMEAIAKPYELSIKAVFRVLGINLKEVENWNCCGSTPFISTDKDSAEALINRNIGLIEKSDKDVVIACSSCFKMLKAGSKKVKVRHILDIIANDVGCDRIARHVKVPLKNISVAPYYGCCTVRPKPSFDDEEDPQSMDMILKVLGANVPDYEFKAFCCGGTLMIIDEKPASMLISNILGMAEERKADCIATPCPLCHMNLDKYQDAVNKSTGKNHHIPIFFFTQLMGLSFGLSPKELGLQGKWFETNFVSTKNVIKKIKGEG